MPGPVVKPAASRRRLPAPACLAGVVLVVALAPPVPAGPIAESFARWSNQRKTQSHAEKPFSGQSSPASAGQGSILHGLRSRLTTRSAAGTTTHTMKTETFHHAGGSLVR